MLLVLAMSDTSEMELRAIRPSQPANVPYPLDPCRSSLTRLPLLVAARDVFELLDRQRQSISREAMLAVFWTLKRESLARSHSHPSIGWLLAVFIVSVSLVVISSFREYHREASLIPSATLSCSSCIWSLICALAGLSSSLLPTHVLPAPLCQPPRPPP